MGFFLIFLLVALALGYFYIHRYYSHGKKELQPNPPTALIEQIGSRIIERLETDPSSHRPISHVAGEAMRTPPRVSLPPELQALADQLVNLLVGKYTLNDPPAIAYVRTGIERVLDHLQQSKPLERILQHYNPRENDDLLLEGCRDLFDYPRLEPLKKLLVGQFIINKTQDGEEMELVYNYITSLALNPNIPATVRMNAADILNLSNSSKYMKIAKQALELLRRGEDRPLRVPMGQVTTATARRGPAQPRLGQPAITGAGTWPPIIPPIIGREDPGLQRVLWEQAGTRVPIPATRPTVDRTVYEDGQNVHNAEINNSVLDAAKDLVQHYRPTTGELRFDQQLAGKLDHTNRLKIDSALHRILTDSSTFKYGTTLHSIFQSLLQFISQHPQKDELNQRLLQELQEMSGLCASGHMTRLLNVPQGFDIKPELKIKVNIGEEVYAKLAHVLQQKMMTEEDGAEVLDLLADDQADKAPLKDFVTRHARALLPELRQEYKDTASPAQVDKEIINALVKYTKQKDFDLQALTGE